MHLQISKVNLQKRLFVTIFCFVTLLRTMAQNTKPNILFIMSDDHTASFLGTYGNPDLKTPNIDKLAKEGIQFNRAYTTAPQCVPSRASIMTGRSQVEIGMTRFSAPLPAEIESYPEYLREGGYYTGIAGRTFHLNGTKRDKVSEAVFEKYQLETFKSRVDYLQIATTLEATFSQYNEFLDNAPKNKPFFLQLAFSDPHRVFDAKDYEPDPTKLKVPDAFPDTKLLREDLAGYYGEIQRFDASLGKILEELDKRGLSKNTLVLFVGDNGGALIRGKGTLHRIGIHVPLIVRFPGVVKPGQVSNALVSGIDIAPTFLEAAGLPVPANFTGKSLVPALQGKVYDGHEYVYAARSAHGASLPTSSDVFDLGRTVFNKKYKLIYNALWQLPYAPVDFKTQPFWIELQQLHDDGRLSDKWDKLLFSKTRLLFELYDSEKDIEEFDNLSGRLDLLLVENELKARLQEWMIVNRDYLPLPLDPLIIK